MGIQPGHPLGFYSHAYAGEVALCRVLVDPSGELADLAEQTSRYPRLLGEALVAGVWEADFATRLARYGAAARDPAYAAGCLFRAVGVVCHALHGHGRRWLINEKGAVASAGALATAPVDFAGRVRSLLGAVGESPEQIIRTVSAAEELIAEVRTVVQDQNIGEV